MSIYILFIEQTALEKKSPSNLLKIIIKCCS